MSMIITERWDRLKRGIRPRTWERIKWIAGREQMSLSAVVHHYYATVLPKRLHKLASITFTDDSVVYHTAQRDELKKRLRYHERMLEKRA